MWGIKASTFIPAYTYIIEYAGEIVTKDEGDRRGKIYDCVGSNYLFDFNKDIRIEKINKR